MKRSDEFSASDNAWVGASVDRSPHNQSFNVVIFVSYRNQTCRTNNWRSDMTFMRRIICSRWTWRDVRQDNNSSRRYNCWKQLYIFSSTRLQRFDGNRAAGPFDGIYGALRALALNQSGLAYTPRAGITCINHNLRVPAVALTTLKAQKGLYLYIAYIRSFSLVMLAGVYKERNNIYVHLNIKADRNKERVTNVCKQRRQTLSKVCTN